MKCGRDVAMGVVAGFQASATRSLVDSTMPEYLATVRRGKGRRITENVVAESTDEAVRLLRERGYDEIVLHNDDVMALLTRQREKAAHVTPADYIRLRNLPRGVGLFVVITLQGYRKLWPMMIVVALGLVYIRLNRIPSTYWDWLCGGFLLFPPVFAFLATLFGSGASAQYRSMLDSLYWGRWEEALERADRIRARPLPQDLPFRKAQALAGMGRLEEALNLVVPLGDGEAMPLWFYHSMLAQVYEFAHCRDDAIAEIEQSVELAPDNPTMLISLGRHLIWHRRDAQRARELLAQARMHALSDMVAPFADLLEGNILFEEGRPREALSILEPAYRVFSRRRHMPLGYLPVETSMLSRALAHAALGEYEEAQLLYKQVRPRLVARGSDVVERCDRTIGVV